MCIHTTGAGNKGDLGLTSLYNEETADSRAQSFRPIDATTCAKRYYARSVLTARALPTIFHAVAPPSRAFPPRVYRRVLGSRKSTEENPRHDRTISRLSSRERPRNAPLERFLRLRVSPVFPPTRETREKQRPPAGTFSAFTARAFFFFATLARGYTRSSHVLYA